MSFPVESANFLELKQSMVWFWGNFFTPGFKWHSWLIKGQIWFGIQLCYIKTSRLQRWQTAQVTVLMCMIEKWRRWIFKGATSIFRASTEKSSEQIKVHCSSSDATKMWVNSLNKMTLLHQSCFVLSRAQLHGAIHPNTFSQVFCP